MTRPRAIGAYNLSDINAGGALTAERLGSFRNRREDSVERCTSPSSGILQLRISPYNTMPCATERSLTSHKFSAKLIRELFQVLDPE
jgi:hypothetical protein